MRFQNTVISVNLSDSLVDVLVKDNVSLPVWVAAKMEILLRYGLVAV